MIWGLLSGLGLGEQLFAAGLMLVVAWYLLRALSMAGTLGVAVSSGIMYAVVTAVVLAVALAAGWLDPQMGAIMNAVSKAEHVFRTFVVDVVESALEGAT
ncbi:hypothetical protein [Halobacterium litoreum]|uniref:Colicin V production protein n=1 Tax=Halobacterium litoreum TaxID=2039234 RepID=A0ABD5NA93_9EURY|nr:hypothetical protein [Halobacterium litoreum]UHH11992.1 hypothetical protein LT972_07455 [Halobacterium litoreum]